MPKSQNFEETFQNLEGIPVSVQTYQIGDSWYCHVSNKDPGATISRSEGKSRNEAEKLALDKAGSRLKKQP